MSYADIHIHALFDVDDGAGSEAEMFAMIDASYNDGIRDMCLTPHFHPGFFGDNTNKINTAYKILTDHVQNVYPDMRLYLGNELRYSNNYISWLDSGQCKTLNGTKYVLIDFSELEEARIISGGLERLLNAGYWPVLAHVERYCALWGNTGLIRSFKDNEVLLQMDTLSPLGGFGFRTKRQSRALLSEKLIDLVCSDSHDMTRRPPGMSKCYEYIMKKHGVRYADVICGGNAQIILNGTAGGKESDQQ